MSNTIEAGKINRREIDTARRRNEKEVSLIDSAHEDIKAEIKKSHTAELDSVRIQHEAALEAQARRKEKILEEMRTHVQTTKNLTEKELKALEQHKQSQNMALETRYTKDREMRTAENEMFLEEMNHDFNQRAKDIHLAGQNQINDTAHAKKLEHETVRSTLDHKINRQRENMTTQINTDKENFERTKRVQENEFKRARVDTNVNQQRVMSKLVDQHSQHLKTQDTQFRTGLKDKDLFFEQRYQEQLKAHEDKFKNLESLHEKAVNKLKQDLSKEVSKHVTRSDDPFYQFTELRPTMTDLEKQVQIKVEVPDHAKQDLQLTTNGKEAILSFNRRFTDAKKTEDGTFNKISKIETFQTRLQTGAHLDPKSVKSTYDNGVMTYTINKA